MTVRLHDAKASHELEHGHALQTPLGINELVYADDTLLVGVDSSSIQLFMEHIGRAGRSAGLSCNWSKLEALTARTQASFQRPDGKPVPVKESILYLGSALAADRRVSSELGRRIGQAQAYFRSL